MRRINSKLDSYELADLMSDSDNWDLLAQIHDHPSTWPELGQWAAHAIAHPETAGAPPEPLPDRKPKHRLLPITPIIDDELPRDIRNNSTPVSKPDKRTGTTIDTPIRVGEHVEDDVSLAELSADDADEVAVHRHIPFTRIAGIMLALVTVTGLATGLVMAKRNYDHREALTSCNHAIEQSDIVRIEWDKALKQAEPYAKLQDKDVQDPKSLELLGKIMQYQPSVSTENCDPSLTADRLDRTRAETEKANSQLRIQTRNLHDTVDTVKASQEQQRIDNAQNVLSQTIENADRLYKESENKVRDDNTRARLSEQITRARLMMRDHQDLDVYNRTIQDLNEVMQIVRDSMTAVKNEEISDAGRSDESTQPGSDSQSSNRQPAPSSEDLSPSVTHGNSTWDVPGQSVTPSFPDRLG
ncbi:MULTISPECIES: hypothetical protein [Bifidobacterium]|uniref:Molecular chaperone n=1 Tax=Bifidobacterium biavatii DSM 23969 TaxID=1437608 RepID=A0A086ZXJ1_9BIFI|nr:MULTISPECIES: hypothetical protein [Bifidobacterium]KFI51241.1 molecular chaperone [Bifidobacterium biavatii DSM 23969]